MILFLLATLAYSAQDFKDKAQQCTDGGNTREDVLVFNSWLDTPMGDLLSDHTWQIMMFEDITDIMSSHVQTVAKGLTWNITSQGRVPTKIKPYTNNAFNVLERDDEYNTRKQNQVNQLRDLIKQYDLDFVFLQELDAQSTEEFSSVAFCEKLQRELMTVEPEKEMQIYFSETLEQAILYDSKKWQLTDTFQQSIEAWKKTLEMAEPVKKLKDPRCVPSKFHSKSLALEIENLTTKETLSLVNIHGQFDAGWVNTWNTGESKIRQNLDAHLRAETADLEAETKGPNKIAIVGGDWNIPVPGVEKYNCATNFDLPCFKDRVNVWEAKAVYREITEPNLRNVLMNHTASKTPKQYDGFVAHAKERHMLVYKLRGECFEQDPASGSLYTTERRTDPSDYKFYSMQENLKETI